MGDERAVAMATSAVRAWKRTGGKTAAGNRNAGCRIR